MFNSTFRLSLEDNLDSIYIKNHQGAVLDVSLLKDSEFSEIPYKTLLKMLNRLEEEKLIFGISKGVYAIGKLNVQDGPDIVRFTKTADLT